MFSGIIQHFGKLTDIQPQPQLVSVRIASPAFSEDALKGYPLKIGDSVAISGVCLTVTEFSPQREEACFDIVSETLRRTTLGSLQVGSLCHIERSLRMGESLDGHLVFGHVDATTKLLKRVPEGETQKLLFELPKDLAHLFAEKGSVSLSGVSLTLGEVTKESFSVYLIPHTLEKTIFSQLSVGESVNVEVDMIARYVARILGASCSQ